MTHRKSSLEKAYRVGGMRDAAAGSTKRGGHGTFRIAIHPAR
jgi:hypothetical protein